MVFDKKQLLYLSRGNTKKKKKNHTRFDLLIHLSVMPNVITHTLTKHNLFSCR